MQMAKGLVKRALCRTALTRNTIADYLRAFEDYSGIVSDNQSRVVDGRHYSVASIAHSVTLASAMKAAAASGGNFSHGQASGQTPTYLPMTAWRWFRLLCLLTGISKTRFE
jgi:hypothetical protein